MSLLPKGIEGNTVWVLPGTVPHHETERLVAGSLETVSGGFALSKIRVRKQQWGFPPRQKTPLSIVLSRRGVESKENLRWLQYGGNGPETSGCGCIGTGRRSAGS